MCRLRCRKKEYNMPYYIAADGGGTKLTAVLYDENLNILRTAKRGGTNGNFRPEDIRNAEAKELAEELLADGIDEIESVDCSIVGAAEPLFNALKSAARVKNFRHHGEGNVPLFASGVRYGVTAQAGTGSDVFFIQPDGGTTIGGWGTTLGDEGSGYDIGVHTLRAAIKASDGRAKPTAILDILREDWKIDKMWDLVGRVYGNPDARLLIASASYVCEKAADLGDETAIGIYRYAGHEMSEQFLTGAAKLGGSWVGPVIMSGGAWKGSRVMADTFTEDIHAVYPEADIRFPVFEPLCGSIIERLLDEGRVYSEFEDTMKRSFARYLYKPKQK